MQQELVSGNKRSTNYAQEEGEESWSDKVMTRIRFSWVVCIVLFTNNVSRSRHKIMWEKLISCDIFSVLREL